MNLNKLKPAEGSKGKVISFVEEVEDTVLVMVKLQVEDIKVKMHALVAV